MIDDEEADESKRAVDLQIADELQQQEDSYQEQITSLQIGNNNSKRESQRERRNVISITQQAAIESSQEVDLMQDPRVSDRQQLPYDSDEEFKIMDD